MPPTTFIEEYESRSRFSSFTLVKLDSIEHRARHDEAVSSHFDVLVKVDETGLNPKGQYGPASITVPPGAKFEINKVIFTGAYDSAFVPNLNFLFNVDTEDSFASELVKTGGPTGGGNSLQFGVNYFAMPVTIVATSRKSTLVFRGRIDITGSGPHH